MDGGAGEFPDTGAAQSRRWAEDNPCRHRQIAMVYTYAMSINALKGQNLRLNTAWDVFKFHQISPSSRAASGSALQV